MKENYGGIQSGRRSRLKRRITGAIIIAVILAAALWAVGMLASDSAEYQKRSSILRDNQNLLEENAALKLQNEELSARIAALEGQVSERDAYIAALPTEEPLPEQTSEPAEPLSPRTQ